MTVYTRDGEKLGKVVAADDTGLFVEKGLFFPEEYGLGYDEVDEVRDDGVHLRLDKDAVTRAMAGDDRGLERSRPSAVSAVPDRSGTPAEGPTPSSRAAEPEQSTRRAEGLTIPMVGEGIAPMLVEDEVVVVKQAPPAGEGVRASPEEPGQPDDTSSPDRKAPNRHE